MRSSRSTPASRRSNPTTPRRTEQKDLSGPTSVTPTRFARPWAPPGLPGLEHRIGGLEKADGSGNVSYEGVNHERMVHLRPRQVRGDRRRHPARRRQRRNRGRTAAPGELGLDLCRRVRRGEADSCPRHEGGSRPPAPSQSAAAQLGRGPSAGTREILVPRDQPRPTEPHSAC